MSVEPINLDGRVAYRASLNGVSVVKNSAEEAESLLKAYLKLLDWQKTVGVTQ